MFAVTYRVQIAVTLVPSNSWEEIYAFFHTYAQIHKGVPAG
jgi:hypothetical protein